ncbi:MAG: hypothetical protein MZW92_80340 [Comamonadaceae bacterium]|nr:hypothetical protein [Comamonadaceae bacterium]
MMVRTRDETHVRGSCAQAGATEVVPETLEAGPDDRHPRPAAARRAARAGGPALPAVSARRATTCCGSSSAARTPWRRDQTGPGRGPHEARGRSGREVAWSDAHLAELRLTGVVVTALVRRGKRLLAPAAGDHGWKSGDAVVLFGSAQDIDAAERILLG